MEAVPMLETKRIATIDTVTALVNFGNKQMIAIVNATSASTSPNAGPCISKANPRS